MSRHPGYTEDPNLPGFWFYGDLRVQAFVEIHEFVIEFARRTLKPGARILDVATGEGALAQRLVDAGFQVSVTSWDGKCRVEAPTYQVDLDLPFSVDDVGGEPFDLVCCCEIIEHIENPSRFLRDIQGLTKGDGYTIVSTPNVESAEARLQWLVRGRPALFAESEIRDNRHITLLWREGIEHLISLSGFTTAERALLGPLAVGKPPVSWIKRLAHFVMGTIFSGDLTGGSRLYLLRPSSTPPRKQGPGDVY